ncbi:MAG: hypothetical protein J0I45_03110 [Bosea sp.]|nr:hypothetical protein [Bosea sp. (in: a-proteobacteria)]
MRERIELVFLGVFEPASFAEFMRHRAGRLSVAAETRRLDAGRVEVTVEGESALVDMFEVACSLGPLDCLVTDVSRRAA